MKLVQSTKLVDDGNESRFVYGSRYVMGWNSAVEEIIGDLTPLINPVTDPTEIMIARLVDAIRKDRITPWGEHFRNIAKDFTIGEKK